MGKEEFREYSQKYLQIERTNGKRVVFEANEVPFFSVAPEQSDLGVSPKLENELRERYPDLRFERAYVVDGAVLIQDVLAFSPTFGYDTARPIYNVAQRLNNTSGITLQVVDGALPNDYLLRTLAKPEFRRAKPHIIFPGEGARIVSEYIRRQEPAIYDLYSMEKAVYIPTERTMEKPGKFSINLGTDSLPDELQSDTVIIIDDVIGTGQTIQTVSEAIKAKYGNVKTIAMTWFFVKPTVKENLQASSGIKSVDMTIASFALKGNYTSRPPINSLSCFVRANEKPKYDTVKQAFMDKYITDQYAFNQMISELKP